MLYFFAAAARSSGVRGYGPGSRSLDNPEAGGRATQQGGRGSRRQPQPGREVAPPSQPGPGVTVPPPHGPPPRRRPGPQLQPHPPLTRPRPQGRHRGCPRRPQPGGRPLPEDTADSGRRHRPPCAGAATVAGRDRELGRGGVSVGAPPAAACRAGRGAGAPSPSGALINQPLLLRCWRKSGRTGRGVVRRFTPAALS